MKKGFLGNLLVVFVTILILLGIGELVARWYFSKTDATTQELMIYQSNEIFGWEHAPNSEVKQKWGGRELSYSINLSGLRGKEIALQKSPLKKRIALLGDSFAFGLNVQNDETFASKLENLGKNIEIMNFGIIGHAVDQYYLQFREKVLKFKPDIVVMAYFVGNDATELRAHEWTLSETDGLQKLHDVYHVISKDHQLRRKKTSLFPTSYLVTFFRERTRIILAKAGIPVKWPRLLFSNFLPEDHISGDPQIDEYYKKVQFIIAEMKKLTDANGIKFLVTLIPVDLQVDLKYLSKYPRAPFGQKEFDEVLPQKKLRSYLEPLNIMTLDLLPLFRDIAAENKTDNLYFLKNDSHFTPFGHEKTAELLLEKLQSTGWL